MTPSPAPASAVTPAVDGGSTASRFFHTPVQEHPANAKITPHSLRHAWATIALDAGVSPRDLVDSAGWSDARMSRYYDRNRNAIERNATHAVAAFISGAG